MSEFNKQSGKLDRSMPIYEMLEQLDLPHKGQLILPVKTWKRKNWVTKKYVFEYMYDSLSIGLHLFELGYDIDEDGNHIEHHIDTYEVHTIWWLSYCLG